jgi:hypothetical protein
MLSTSPSFLLSPARAAVPHLLPVFFRTSPTIDRLLIVSYPSVDCHPALCRAPAHFLDLCATPLRVPTLRLLLL